MFATTINPPRQIRFRPMIRRMRPSLIDPTLKGDCWLTNCYLPNQLILYLNNQPIALVGGSPLEQSTLNAMLYSMRHRYPRK